MKALSLYPEPGTPGSPFATQYERASEISQDSVFSCMSVYSPLLAYISVMTKSRLNQGLVPCGEAAREGRRECIHVQVGYQSPFGL